MLSIEFARSQFEDYLRTFLFTVVFPDSNVLQFAVESSRTPVDTSEDVRLPWMTSEFKLTGKVSFEDWEVTVRGDINGVVYNALKDWRERVYNKTSGRIGYASEYKRDIQVQLLDLDENPVLSFTLIGAWPKAIQSVDLNMANNEYVRFTTTFAYDYYQVA